MPKKNRSQNVNTDCTDIWSQYRSGVDYLTSRQYFEKSDRAFRFYNGNQWYGVEAGDEYLPVYNIVKPVVKYKTSVVCANAMEIVYSPTNFYDEEHEKYLATCKVLNCMAKNTWELLKLTRRIWDDVKDAAIGGNSYRFFMWDSKNNRIETETVNQTNIIFSDEQQQDIQKQAYIIIAQRDTVSKVKQLAKDVYKCSKETLEAIVGDDATEYELGDYAKNEVDRNDENAKCTLLIKMSKCPEGINIQRATKHIVIQEKTLIPGAKLYPIAALTWDAVKGFSRGAGEVTALVPNQIEINKNLYRTLLANRLGSFPRIMYNEAVISNPYELDQIGAPISINASTVGDIKNHIGYLEPSHISSDAHVLTSNLISTTRELAGAGDIATGQIDPEKASGQAILAVQKSSEQPVSDAIEAYKQYIEDIALIWYDLWSVYSRNGLEVPYENEGILRKITVPYTELENMSISVKIDVSPSSPYDKYAQERSLENMMTAGHIEFEEYVEALPDDAVMPKAKLVAILEKRQAAAAVPTVPPSDMTGSGMQAPGQSPPGGAPELNIPTQQIPAGGAPQMPVPDIAGMLG